MPSSTGAGVYYTGGQWELQLLKCAVGSDQECSVAVRNSGCGLWDWECSGPPLCSHASTVGVVILLGAHTGMVHKQQRFAP